MTSDNNPPVSPSANHVLTGDQTTLMQGFIVDAIHKQPERVRPGLLRQMVQGDLKVTSSWAAVPGPDGKDVPDLTYVVAAVVPDGGYVDLARIAAFQIGITPEQLRAELSLVSHLNGIGIPDDASGLDEVP